MRSTSIAATLIPARRARSATDPRRRCLRSKARLRRREPPRGILGPDPLLSRDPIGEAGGFNLYGYVGNRPLEFVDPHGLLPHVAIGALVGGVGNGVAQAVSNYMNGIPIGTGIPRAIGVGAAVGAAVAAFGPAGVAAGAAVGGAAGVVNAKLTDPCTSWSEAVIVGGGVGAVTGMVGSAIPGAGGVAVTAIGSTGASTAVGGLWDVTEALDSSPQRRPKP